MDLVKCMCWGGICLCLSMEIAGILFIGLIVTAPQGLAIMSLATVGIICFAAAMGLDWGNKSAAK